MNKLRRSILFLGIIFQAFLLRAQTINSELELVARPKLILRYSLFDHVHIKQPAAQIGAEIKVNEVFGINLEAGKIHERVNVFNLGTYSVYQNERRVRGNRYAVELRYYPVNGYFPDNFFLSFKQELERSTITREEKILKFQGEYTELYELEIENRSNSYVFSFGYNIYERKSISITLVNGLGIKHRILTATLPKDATRIFERGWALKDRLEDMTYPMVHFGLYVSWGVVK